MTVKVALAQFASEDTVEGNVSRMETLIRQAAAEGAKLIAFHELATTHYFCFKERDESWLEFAEPVPGPTTDRIQKVVEETGCSAVIPLYELEDGVQYNTAVLIEPGVGIVGKYQKSHVPASKARGEQGGAEENWYFKPGQTGFVAWDSVNTGLRIGTLICFDRHHPEGQRMYGKLGIDILFVPTASYRSFVTGPMWEAELMSAAFQNSYYVAGINKVGKVPFINKEADYPGRSLFVDPEGVIIEKADDQEGIIYAEVDKERIPQIREPLNFFEFRRPDLYEALIQP
jgi:N-carbamoylputrescine amidase